MPSDPSVLTIDQSTLHTTPIVAKNATLIFKDFLKIKGKKLEDLLIGLFLKKVAQVGYHSCSVGYKKVPCSEVKYKSAEQHPTMITAKGLKVQSKEAIYANIRDHLITSNKEDMTYEHILCADLDHCQFTLAKPSSSTHSHSDQWVVPITCRV